MLEDIQVTLTELDKVAFYFKQLDESLVASEYTQFLLNSFFPPFGSCSLVFI